MKYYTNVITKNYVNFTGRATRKEYWMFVLFNALAGVVFAIIASFSGIDIIPQIYSLAVFLPSLGVTVRRLHDVGKGAGWIFIGLVPVVGWIWIIMLLCGQGNFGANAYGDDVSNNIEV
ncbi:MAG: DUF805 domain-containing protein [Oscillospiraceae bacterium]